MALEKAGAPTEKLWDYILGDSVVTAETAEKSDTSDRASIFANHLHVPDHPLAHATRCEEARISLLDMPPGAGSRAGMYDYRRLDALAEALLTNDYWQRCKRPIGGLVSVALRRIQDRILAEERRTLEARLEAEARNRPAYLRSLKKGVENKGNKVPKSWREISRKGLYTR